MTFPLPTYADLRTKRKEPLDDEFFNRRFRLLIEAIRVVAEAVDELGVSNDTLIELGLERIDTVLTPALARVNQAATLGFLVAYSDTSRTLAEDADFEFTIEEENRGLFTPTPFLSITRSTAGAENQYAVAQLLSWDAESGTLGVKVLAIEGISGAHNDWVFSASGATPVSVIAKVAQVADDAAQVADDRAYVESVAGFIAAGPVISVAGKTGAVALALGDVSGLISALAAKADMSHSHPQSAITNLVSDLAAKAALSHTHSASEIASGTLADARLPARLGASASVITDWNGVTSNGWYYGDSAANGPAGISGITVARVFKQDDNNVIQEIYSLTEARSFRRFRVASVWGAWTETLETQASTDARYEQIGRRTGSNEQAGATYQPVLADAGKVIKMNSATAQTFQIPDDATRNFPVDTWFDLYQKGAGQTTIAALNGNVSVVSRGSRFKIAGQRGMAQCWKEAANLWIVAGDLVA